jgi:hypothetical protein
MSPAATAMEVEPVVGWARRLRHKLVRRVGAWRDEREERNQRGQWFLLTGRRAAYDPDALAIDSLRPLYPPHEVFWADPFVWSQDGRSFVFFEERRYRIRRGHIRAWELDRTGEPLGDSFPVIQERYHLSYPYLFEHDGGLFMVPEKAQQERVDVYGCVRFPERWERAATLLEGERLSDSSLFHHDGRWWLFCAGTRGRMRVNETLFAWHAESPLASRWRPHPGNPIVRDFARGRPGGRIQRDACGRLLRPGQDCSRRYGYGLTLNEIIELTPERYRERTRWRASGPAVGGWRGMHHIDWHDGLLAMDAQRLIPGGRPALAPGAVGTR